MAGKVDEQNIFGLGASDLFKSRPDIRFVGSSGPDVDDSNVVMRTRETLNSRVAASSIAFATSPASFDDGPVQFSWGLVPLAFRNPLITAHIRGHYLDYILFAA